jgi:hypothetical protein
VTEAARAGEGTTAGPAAERALIGAAALLDAGPGRARARTVVRLLRYALETGVKEFWDATRPGEIGPRTRGGRRLRLLAAPLGTRQAHEAYALWCVLSDAAKPHPYELAPAADELRQLHARTERVLLVLLEAAQRPGQ